MTYQQHTTIKKPRAWPILMITFSLSTSLHACNSCKNPINTGHSDQPNEQQKPGDKKKQLEQPNSNPSNKTSAEATKKLFEAIEQGNLAGVHASIQQGANMNATNADGDPPLYLALMGNNQNPAIVQALIDHGAHTHFLNSDQGSLLYVAAISSKPEVFKVLLQSKAKDLIDHPDKNGLTALHRAVFFANMPSVLQNMQLLLENGAKVNTKSKNGEMPLDRALSFNDVEAIRLLRKYGAGHNLP